MVRGFLQEADATFVEIGAHRIGAAIAATGAASAPHRVSRLALLHPLGGDVTLAGTFAVLRAFLPLVRVVPRSLLRTDSVGTHRVVQRSHSSPGVRRAVSGVWQTPVRWRQFLPQLAALNSTDMVECTRRLSTLSLPVAIVASDCDSAIPRVALDLVREALPNVTLDIVRGVRHFSPEESPDRIADVVARLIRS